MTRVPRVVLWWILSALLAALPSALAGCDRAQPESDSSLVLAWSREGGFAGFCDDLKVAASGEVTASSCKAAGVKTRKLSGDELARLNQWRTAFGSVTATSQDSATADAMTMKITLSGRGQNQPSESQRQEILEWAQQVYQQTK